MSPSVRLDPPDWRPIVTLEHDHGVAAVCADPDGSLWLVADLDSLHTYTYEVDEDDLAAEVDGDQRCEFGEELDGFELSGVGVTIDEAHAIAGRLPPGATRVTIRDDRDEPVPVAVADGVFVAAPRRAADASDPIMVFEATDGAIVRRPPPAEYSIESAPHLDQRCPGCGTSSWDVAEEPADERPDGRGPPQMSSPTAASKGLSQGWVTGDERFAVCRVCGHREQLPKSAGSITVSPSRLEPVEARAWWVAHHRRLWDQVLAGLGHSPIGLAPGRCAERSVAGWGGASHDLLDPADMIALDHWGLPGNDDAYLSVQTLRADADLGDPIDRWTERALANQLQGHAVRPSVRRARANARSPETSPDHRTLSYIVSGRQRDAEAARAPRAQKTFALDGVAVNFLVMGSDTVWAAYANTGEVAVTLTSDGYRPEDVALVNAQPDDYLLRVVPRAVVGRGRSRSSGRL